MRVNNKIKVFVSSNCGEDRFKIIRQKVKNKLDRTNLISTYLFEAQASSLPTISSYCYKVDDSDVCIFLLEDSAIPDGVQREIVRANSTQKKSLYYFLGQSAKDVIILQQSLKESKQCVFHTVNSFDEFIQCTQDLVNEIIEIYHYYCNGIMIDKDTAQEQFQVNDGDDLVAPKSVFENSDKCKAYLYKFVFAWDLDIKRTNDFDLYCCKFLDVLFRNKNISDFNTALFLDSLHNEQQDDVFSVTQERWKAIQQYFLDNLNECLNHLCQALSLAKDKDMPEWIIKDIYVDIRNARIMIQNENYEHGGLNEAQNELDRSQTPLFYPIVDRYDKLFYKGLLNHNFKEKIKSPYAVTFGSGLDNILNNIVNSYMVAMLYGSLTQIRCIYNRLKDGVFYLCNNYSNWSFRLALCKLMVVDSSSKEINNMINLFNDILDKISEVDAKEIYDYSKNIPIKHARSRAILSAFSSVGYYLNDQNYCEATKDVLEIMHCWLNDLNSIVGQELLSALRDNVMRMDQNILVQFSIDAIQKEHEIFYRDIFMLLSCVDYSKCEPNKIYELIDLLKNYLSNEGKHFYDDACEVLTTIFRSIDYKNDSVVALIQEKHNAIYKNYFQPNTTKDTNVFIDLLHNKIRQIEERNLTQGKNGIIGYANNPYETIKNIISMDVDVKNEVHMIINVCFETLLSPGQTILAKTDAVELLLIIGKEKYICGTIYDEMKAFVECNYGTIYEGKNIMSNLSCVPLKFGIFLFKILLKIESINEIDSQLCNIICDDNIVDLVKVIKLLDSFLSNVEYTTLSNEIKIVIKNIIVFSLQALNKDLRYYALNVLLKLLPYEKDLCEKHIYTAMNSGNCYEKNLMLQKAKSILNANKDLYKTIIEKGLVDGNFCVRANALKIDRI